MARLRFDQIVQRAGDPGSTMGPATAALLSLLVLKLLAKERRSPISDFNFDQALGFFAGLNILPKATFATDYSDRTPRCHPQQLLSGWISALAPRLFPQGKIFSLDFQAIPLRGDPAALDNHFLPRRGQAGPRVLRFVVPQSESRVWGYANANLTRADQPGELMRFVEFWQGLTGPDPEWLYFDSQVVPDPELSRLNRRGIHFVTIRRRDAAVIRRLRRLPPQTWPRALIDTPRRCHQPIRFVDEMIQLPGDDGAIRPLAVDGLGRERPTLFVSNDLVETARSLIIR